MIRLEGRSALVTGGSRGIGRETVRLLARAGARVLFSYHASEKAARSLEEEIGADGGQVASFRADMRVPAETEALVGQALSRFGGLDILVANAGVWPPDPVPLEAMTIESWDDTLHTNLRGVFTLVRAALGPMKKAGSGRVILVSSTAGQRGEAFHASYAASKSALIGLTKSLAVEAASRGVLVNSVAPGWVDTDMSAGPLRSAEAGPILATIPLRRPGTPAEIAGAVLFLASDLATYITGEVLNVNGGSVLCG